MSVLGVFAEQTPSSPVQVKGEGHMANSVAGTLTELIRKYFWEFQIP